MSSWKWWGTIVALSAAVGLELSPLFGSFVGWVTAAAAGSGLMVAPQDQRKAKHVVLTYLAVGAATALLYYAGIKRFR